MERVTHFEFGAEDIDRATKFYTEVFGWEIKKDPTMDYWMVMTGPSDDNGKPAESGFIHGGMYKRMEGTQPSGDNGCFVIDASDIDGFAKKIEEAGGSIVMPKRDVGTYGWYLRFKDTEGNTVGLWQMKPRS